MGKRGEGWLLSEEFFRHYKTTGGWEEGKKSRVRLLRGGATSKEGGRC